MKHRVTAERVPNHADVAQPGQFQFLTVCGTPTMKISAVAAMEVGCPRCGKAHELPRVSTTPTDRRPSYLWDGMVEVPTLSMAIAIPPHSGCPGWHGWLRRGEFQNVVGC
ncbi:hypothetical protein [Maricaulis maris]|uniref:hypothetical protein n=1 Tax=Maricaulis maris TaxID=74318 RepID=UPI003B8C3B5D